MNMLALMAARPPIRVSPSASGDRDLRLERAVALVVDAKYSVRKAAHALSLPKSTVHRYLQATRSTASTSTSSSSSSPPPLAPAPAHDKHALPHRVAKRPRPARRRGARPAKCELKFLLQQHHQQLPNNPHHHHHADHTYRHHHHQQHHQHHHQHPRVAVWPTASTPSSASVAEGPVPAHQMGQGQQPRHSDQQPHHHHHHHHRHHHHHLTPAATAVADAGPALRKADTRNLRRIWT